MKLKRLPESLAAEGAKWKRVFLIGLSLAGDEARLAMALKRPEDNDLVYAIDGEYRFTDSFKETYKVVKDSEAKGVRCLGVC